MQNVGGRGEDPPNDRGIGPIKGIDPEGDGMNPLLFHLLPLPGRGGHSIFRYLGRGDLL